MAGGRPINGLTNHDNKLLVARKGSFDFDIYADVKPYRPKDTPDAGLQLGDRHGRLQCVPLRLRGRLDLVHCLPNLFRWQ